MKQFSPPQLQQENPDLIQCITDGCMIAFKEVQQEVSNALKDAPMGALVDHCLFMRIVDDKNNLVFVEVECAFMKAAFANLPLMAFINIYDNEAEYEKARQDVQGPSMVRIVKGYRLNPN